MDITNDPVDVVVVGLGWAGSIMSIELANAGLTVRALERGADRTNADFAYPTPADELAFAHRHKTMAPPSLSTVTYRHNLQETALPMRELGSFRMGNGVGGAGVHWTAQLIRPRPTDLALHSFVREHYRPGQLQQDLQIQDYPVSWADLEPHYDFFEKVCGLSGQAGNVRGKILPGGDPFEGERSNPFPLPSLQDTLSCSMFRKVATDLGYHPFTNPSAAVSQAYTNPYGMQIAPCNYCGFCSFYECLNFSKASPQTTILDAVKRKPNFSYRTHAEVIRVDLHPDGKTARGVTYVDGQGNHVFQPAKMVILSSFALNNVRLLLLSRIGKPYDPVSGEGVVGRNYAFQHGGGYTLFFDKLMFNPFATSGATGVMCNDFSPGTYDVSSLDFVGGAKIHGSQVTGAPISTAMRSGVPKWGSGWKKGLKSSYGHSMTIKMTVSNMSMRGNYLDLDPTYKDQHGLPLMRMTYDYPMNDLKLMHFLSGKMETMVKALNPDSYLGSWPKLDSHYSLSPAYVSTHNTGGTVMGSDPHTSVVNKYLQSWDVHNVFVPGASVFPQNFQANPTAHVGALTYWCAKAIRDQYLKDPRPLVQL